MDCVKLPLQMATWMSIRKFILLFTSTSNSIYRLSVKLPLQMARWMSVRLFIILFTCTSNSIYRLSVKLPLQMVRWMSIIRTFILLFTSAHQIQFIICLSSCHFKWRDGCQSGCSFYCLLQHIKFNLSSVCQVATSNGDMDVNQDVHFIVYFSTSNSICSLSVKLSLQMARWMSIRMFILLLTSTSNSIYRLSVKLPPQMPRWMSNRMFILLFT